MSIQRNVPTTNKKSSIWPRKKLKDKNLRKRKVRISLLKLSENGVKNNKSVIMTTLSNRPIRLRFHHATMFGFIMCVLFGFQSAILRRKMEISVLEEYKMSNTKDSKMSVLCAKRINVELVLNAKIHSATNIIILNAPGKKKYTWNS